MLSKANMRAALVALALFATLAWGRPSYAASEESFHVPVEYYKLPNGLRVVLSPDHTAPTVAWEFITASVFASSRATGPALLTCSST